MRCGLVPLLLVSALARAESGVPQDGFPNWGERTLLVLVNRWRAEPTAEANNCSSPIVRPPLAWDYALNRAARFHSTMMHTSEQRMHNSPCVLASNLASTYLPNTACNGAVSCACSTGW